MVTTKHLIMTAIVLTVGIIAFIVFFQSEEAKIKKQFKFIAEKIEKEQDENPIISAAKAKTIREVITDPLKINAPTNSFSREISYNELSTFLLAKRSLYSEISLKFYDFVIDFPEKNAAIVKSTEIMQGQLTSGELIEDIHEIKCILQKIDNTWKFKEIEVIEVLKK